MLSFLVRLESGCVFGLQEECAVCSDPFPGIGLDAFLETYESISTIEYFHSFQFRIHEYGRRWKYVCVCWEVGLEGGLRRQDSLVSLGNLHQPWWDHSSRDAHVGARPPLNGGDVDG